MKEEATEIEFIFQPKTMTDVDMIAGTFEIIGFLDLEWIDTRLSWSSPEMKEMIFIKKYYLNIFNSSIFIIRNINDKKFMTCLVFKHAIICLISLQRLAFAVAKQDIYLSRWKKP